MDIIKNLKDLSGEGNKKVRPAPVRKNRVSETEEKSASTVPATDATNTGGASQ